MRRKKRDELHDDVETAFRDEMAAYLRDRAEALEAELPQRALPVPRAPQSLVDGIVRAKLGEFLPLVGSGDMTAQEALDAAAEAYTEEATAQGYITE